MRVPSWVPEKETADACCAADLTTGTALGLTPFRMLSTSETAVVGRIACLVLPPPVLPSCGTPLARTLDRVRGVL